MFTIVPNKDVSNDLTLADEVFKITKNDQGNFEITEAQLLKQLFDSNNNSLLKRIVDGETTFTETLRPLIEEHSKLKAFSVLGDTCMTDEFIALGQNIKAETKGLMSTEYLVTFPQIHIVCDIAEPFSRASLLKDVLFKFRHIFGFCFAMFLLILYFNFFDADYGHLIALDFLGSTILNFSISFVTLFCLAWFIDYQRELRLRLMICEYVWTQALRMDDIVNKIFPKN